MREQFKKISAYFLLFLFLFPTIEKQLHAFEHRSDEHCVATDKHFHAQEHHCSICDFTVAPNHPSAETKFQFILFSTSFLYVSQRVSTPIATTDYLLPSRAPPIV
jgi:hypothetical protein